MSTLARRLAALERKILPPGPPTLRERYPDLPPDAEAIVAAAVLDAACAVDVATGGAQLSAVGPAILMHHDRVIEALRAGRTAPGPLSEYGEIIDPGAIAELLHAVGYSPRST